MLRLGLALILTLSGVVYGQDFHLSQDEFDYLYRGNKGQLSQSNGHWYWKNQALIRTKEISSFYITDALDEAIKSLNASSANEIFEFVHQFYAVDPLNALDILERYLKYDYFTAAQSPEIEKAIKFYKKSWFYRGKNFGENSYGIILKKLGTKSQAADFVAWWSKRDPEVWNKLAEFWNTDRFTWSNLVREGVYEGLSNSGNCAFHFL